MSNELEKLYGEMRSEAQNNPVIKDRVIVTGEGSTSPLIMLIGEAPGGEEERLVRPFVGSAGKNLDEFLRVLEQKRENMYITNLVKVRPTKQSEKTGQLVNRPPNRNEIEFFTPYLERELDLLSPKLIVTLGNFSLKALLRDSSVTIGKLHGKNIVFNKNHRLFPLYHPAAIIYNRELMQTYNEDLQVLKLLLNKIEQSNPEVI